MGRIWRDPMLIWLNNTDTRIADANRNGASANQSRRLRKRRPRENAPAKEAIRNARGVFSTSTTGKKYHQPVFRHSPRKNAVCALVFALTSRRLLGNWPAGMRTSRIAFTASLIGGMLWKMWSTAG